MNNNEFQNSYYSFFDSIFEFILKYPFFIGIIFLLVGIYYSKKINNKFNAEFYRNTKTDLSLGQVNRVFGNKRAIIMAKIYGYMYLFLALIIFILQIYLFTNKS